jgi:hypothetical protein
MTVYRVLVKAEIEEERPLPRQFKHGAFIILLDILTAAIMQSRKRASDPGDKPAKE